MAGAGEFGHGNRREGGGEFRVISLAPRRAGRADKQQYRLPDAAGEAGQVSGGQRVGFAR
jgi:hypothetical protein